MVYCRYTNTRYTKILKIVKLWSRYTGRGIVRVKCLLYYTDGKIVLSVVLSKRQLCGHFCAD